MTESTIALFGLIGAAIGAIPGVLGVVIPWMRNRDRSSQAMRELDLAKKEVEFIAAWIDAASNLADEEERKDIKATARKRLDSLMSANERASDTLASIQTSESQNKPRRKGSTFLFIYTGFFLFMLFGASIDEAGNPSFSYMVQEITAGDGFTAILLFGIPLIFLFWRWYRSGRAAKN